MYLENPCSLLAILFLFFVIYFLDDFFTRVAEKGKKMEFKLHSEYKMMGDQPEAVERLAAGIAEGRKYQTLMGVTGSGKTFTMANLIQQVQKPTLVISQWT